MRYTQPSPGASVKIFGGSPCHGYTLVLQIPYNSIVIAGVTWSNWEAISTDRQALDSAILRYPATANINSFPFSEGVAVGDGFTFNSTAPCTPMILQNVKAALYARGALVRIVAGAIVVNQVNNWELDVQILSIGSGQEES